MIDKKDYTLCLSPGGKTRYAVGPYDRESQTPRYTIEISIFQHVKHQVAVKQFLLGSGNQYQWAYEIHNKSSYPAFIIIKKDNVIVKDPCFE